MAPQEILQVQVQLIPFEAYYGKNFKVLGITSSDPRRGNVNIELVGHLPPHP